VNAMGTLPYPNAQAVFQQQYESVRRDELIGVLLALFLGGFGAHHFYLGRVGMGVVYLVFSWTGIPWIIGWVECFFMPARVRMYNAVQAAALAAALGISVPGWAGYPGWVAPGYGGGYAQPAGAAGAPPVSATGETMLVACPNCRNTNPVGSRFCSVCGNALA
jgi:TM2 domain-containing membrane protein YozV